MLRIGQSELEAIRRHAEEVYAHECCGVLLGTTNGRTRTVTAARRCGNEDAAADWFAIDPREILRVERKGRQQGWDTTCWPILTRSWAPLPAVSSSYLLDFQ